MKDATTTYYHTDSKALRKERQKKIALGHKEDDYEEEQTGSRPCDGLLFFIARIGFERKERYEK